MKKYLVIGGSSGIGEALANKLSNDGHNVLASYNENKKSDIGNITYFPLDVTADELDVSLLPDSIDGLIYCPGAITLKPFHRLKKEAFLEDLDVQVFGAISVIQHVLDRLKKGVNPSIVLFSSVAAQNGFNFHSLVSVSKGAIEGLTKSLSAEFAPTIRVNAIAPSITNTPLASKLLSNEQKIEANAERHPLKKIGTPEQIAGLASFLLSDEASWITGQIITVDGGISTIK